MPATKTAPRVKRNPVRRKPQTRGEVTRERLLEVALDQFVLHGFHGTSMRQIAGAAGLAVGGIYNHFGSKDEVFAAVLDANHPYRVVEAVLQDVGATTLEGFVRETSARVWAAVQGRQHQLLPLMSIELVEFQGVHLRALAESVFPRVLDLVQRLEQSNETRPLPAPVILRAFVSLMVGHLLIDTIFGRSDLFRQMDYDWLGANVDIFLRGVLQDKGRTS